MGEYKLGDHKFKNKITLEDNGDETLITIGEIIFPEEIMAEIENKNQEAMNKLPEEEDNVHEEIMETELGDYTFKYKVTMKDDGTIKFGKIDMPEELSSKYKKDLEREVTKEVK